MSWTSTSSYFIFGQNCSCLGYNSFFGVFTLYQTGGQRVPTPYFHKIKLAWQAGRANCFCYVNTKRWQFTWLAKHKQRRVPGDELRCTLTPTIIYKPAYLRHIITSSSNSCLAYNTEMSNISHMQKFISEHRISLGTPYSKLHREAQQLAVSSALALSESQLDSYQSDILFFRRWQPPLERQQCHIPPQVFTEV